MTKRRRTRTWTRRGRSDPRMPVVLTAADIWLARVWAAVEILSKLPPALCYGVVAAVLLALVLVVALVVAYWKTLALILLGLWLARRGLRELERRRQARREYDEIPYP